MSYFAGLSHLEVLKAPWLHRSALPDGKAAVSSAHVVSEYHTQSKCDHTTQCLVEWVVGQRFSQDE